MSVMIQVSELSHTTEDAIKVLEGVHLHVERGELVLLLGAAAAGKSILLLLLSAQLPPQSGQVLVLGRNIPRLSREKAADLRRRIGFLPQGFTPLRRTVLGQVAFKLRALGDFREKAEERALVALEQVGLAARAGAPGEELAPLDRVRLGLALAVANEPSLLLADEPFAELTEHEREDALALLFQLRRGGITSLVATRGPVPPGTGRILHLADGKVTGA
jgi:ABC-type ATPase involved in cell division